MSPSGQPVKLQVLYPVSSNPTIKNNQAMGRRTSKFMDLLTRYSAVDTFKSDAVYIPNLKRHLITQRPNS